jgi:TatD DNase family protein
VLIDSHCHLDAAEFDGDREAVVARARAAGVAGIVVPAVERANFGAVASVCRDNDLCRPAYGIHPMYVDRADPDDLDQLPRQLVEGHAVAVGEIGLDHFVADADRQRQQQYFTAQLAIARDLRLPVILHVRRAVDAVLAGLRRVRVVGGIAHAFNGSRQQADQLVDLGFKLGFGGAMTHPRALHLRDLARTLPLAAMVLETDAPDIPPHWLQHGRNEPAELAGIAAALAELRQLPVHSILAATASNVMEALPAFRETPLQP